jgi:hypothetical protein
VVLKLGHFRNMWEVLKCGGGGGWRSSVGLIVRELKKCYKESRIRGMCATNSKKKRG